MSNSSKIKMLLVAMLLAPMATHAFNVNIGNVKVEFKVLDDEKHLVQLGEGKKNRPAVAATTPGTLVIPETDEPMLLAIWRDGHVDSGSEHHVIDCMAQF